MYFSFICFFSSRRRHTRFKCDWSSDVCSSDLKIADGLACGGILGLLHRLFKFLRQDVFLVGFLEPGVRKLVFALAVLFGEDLLRVAEVHIRTSLHRRFMREHRAENPIDGQLCLAARASDVEVFAVRLCPYPILSRFQLRTHPPPRGGACRADWPPCHLRSLDECGNFHSTAFSESG